MYCSVITTINMLEHLKRKFDDIEANKPIEYIFDDIDINSNNKTEKNTKKFNFIVNTVMSEKIKKIKRSKSF